MLRMRKQINAATIQKYMKGYVVHKKMYYQIRQYRLNQNYEYFHKLK